MPESTPAVETPIPVAPATDGRRLKFKEVVKTLRAERDDWRDKHQAVEATVAELRDQVGKLEAEKAKPVKLEPGPGNSRGGLVPNRAGPYGEQKGHAEQSCSRNPLGSCPAKGPG